MYTDDEERTGLPIKTFLISLILIIIFILLLMWLLPIQKNSNNSGSGNGNSSGGNYYGWESLTNRIFNSNIQDMKNVGITYFTTDKLPENVGESKTLTLQEMLDMKLLLPFTDKNGKACDTKGSYVTLTKEEDSYEMKVNLKCEDEEDYILTTLGCYSYCTDPICEKKEEPKPTPVKPKNTSCTLYVAEGNKGENGWYLGNVVVKFKNKTAQDGSSIVSYGIGNTTVANYNKNDSYTVTKDGITTVYGYVKDSNGKTAICNVEVKKDTTTPNCSLTVLSGNKAANGAYASDVVVGFLTKTDTISGIAQYGMSNKDEAVFNSYSRYTVSTNGTHKIYGFVKDKAGHVAKCDLTVKRDKKEEPKTSNPSCTLVVKDGKLGANNWYIGNVTIGFGSKTTTNGATITSFGIGTKENYSNNETYVVSSDTKYTAIYGYVKDSNGNTARCDISIKKDSTKPSCTLKVISGTYNSNGYYTSDVVVGFDKNYDATSLIASYGMSNNSTVTYNGSKQYKITAAGSYKIYGFVKDNAGNTNICTYTVEKRDGLEYQYSKSIANQYSEWSNWTTSTYSLTNVPKFGKYTLVEIEDLGKQSVFDHYKQELGEKFYKNEIVKVGDATQTYCKGYKYYRDVTVTTTTYRVIETSTWVSKGLVSTTSIPKDTLSVRYDFVGFDWKCTGCETTPRKIWNRYERDGVVSFSTTDTQASLSAECIPEEKTIEIYQTVPIFVDYEVRNVPVYRDEYHYKYRTRTLVKEAYIDYVWSIYNDTNLLNNGYSYTGNKRVVG